MLRTIDIHFLSYDIYVSTRTLAVNSFKRRFSFHTFSFDYNFKRKFQVQNLTEFI